MREHTRRHETRGRRHKQGKGTVCIGCSVKEPMGRPASAPPAVLVLVLLGNVK